MQDGQYSPILFRLPSGLVGQIRQAAASSGLRLSDIAETALSAYIADLKIVGPTPRRLKPGRRRRTAYAPRDLYVVADEP